MFDVSIRRQLCCSHDFAPPEPQDGSTGGRLLSMKATNSVRERLTMEIFDSRIPIWIFDQETLKILEVNNAAIDRYGYSRQQFLEMTLLDLRPSTDIPAFLRSTLSHPHAASEPEIWRHRDKSGKIFDVKIVSQETTFRGRRAELVRIEVLSTVDADQRIQQAVDSRSGAAKLGISL